jgi:hypothetical protein
MQSEKCFPRVYQYKILVADKLLDITISPIELTLNTPQEYGTNCHFAYKFAQTSHIVLVALGMTSSLPPLMRI